ncbi:flagellar basal body rod protein [Melaminivora suipulveris]|uniref:Flagellar basal body rod protein n=1 Tax=Melaminivora suipulveris TaxID=2109913 RepID=A0A2R3QC98_9BURK|nr:flagellar basal body protein [Melaminivora suipulveris]AVO49403.1 flagellar basal body rod protein [Melaminivora suipulveris]
MTSIVTTASSGLQAAQLRLAASAHNVANAGTAGFHRSEVAQQAAPALNGVQAQSGQAAQPGVALEGEAVEQIAAAYAFKASVLVLRTAQDITGTLLDERA